MHSSSADLAFEFFGATVEHFGRRVSIAANESGEHMFIIHTRDLDGAKRAMDDKLSVYLWQAKRWNCTILVFAYGDDRMLYRALAQKECE